MTASAAGRSTRIRAAIFDLGHTLWDIEPAGEEVLDAAYASARDLLCERLGRDDLPPPGDLRHAVTAALAADAETYFEDGAVLDQPPTHHWTGRGFRSLGLDVEETLLAELTPLLFGTEVDRLVVHEGTLEALDALHQSGLLLGCVTNTLAGADTIHTMLRNHGILGLMRSVVVSSEEGYRKPHPSLFEKALDGLSVGPEEAVFVGDSPYHDVAGAKALGMRAVLTRQYVARPPVQGAPEPDATIAHLRELADIIAGWR
jgi:HAD superfamily hydrolase (TIGR01509 family)